MPDVSPKLECQRAPRGKFLYEDSTSIYERHRNFRFLKWNFGSGNQNFPGKKLAKKKGEKFGYLCESSNSITEDYGGR